MVYFDMRKKGKVAGLLMIRIVRPVSALSITSDGWGFKADKHIKAKSRYYSPDN